MKAITQLGQTYAAKNKLEKATLAFLKECHGLFLEDYFGFDDIKYFKEYVLRKIKVLEATFPRCKPLNANWQLGYTKDYWILRGVNHSFTIVLAEVPFQESPLNKRFEAIITEVDPKKGGAE